MEEGRDLGEHGQDEEQRVLVAIINNQRDFCIARDQGWYRIPLKRAPKQIAADFLAFYQTGAFAEGKWSICYYAPVKGYRLVTRAQLLPEEAAHPRAKDYYYKIELGPLQKLPKPIPSQKLRRVTFIPTTLKRLLQAQEINDLWEGPPSAEKLWQALQVSGVEAERQYEVREGRAGYLLDFAIFCRQGKVAIECMEEPSVSSHPLSQQWADILRAKGWDLVQFTPRQLDDPWTCLKTIQERVEAYGGLPSARGESEE